MIDIKDAGMRDGMIECVELIVGALADDNEKISIGEQEPVDLPQARMINVDDVIDKIKDARHKLARERDQGTMTHEEYLLASEAIADMHTIRI